ncbi:hypothetical protein QOT17_006856 [Balamuthia mandrillaris]
MNVGVAPAMLARQGSLLPWRASLVCLQRTSVNKAWQTGCWSRSYVKAADLRRGQAFRFRGSIWEIVEIGQSRNTARGAAHVSATIKDLETGVRKIERFRSAENVEDVILEKGTFTYKGQEKDKLLFENMEEGITVSCPASKLGHRTTYLKEGMRVRLKTYEEKPLIIILPTRAAVTVADGGVNMRDTQASPSPRKVKLENGRTVSVPPHIATGDKIWVNIEEETYQGKVEEDEDEEDQLDEED